jgi:hypothetical protein
VAVERVAKDLSGLSAEQRLAAVQQDAPELLQLIAELREGLTEVRSRVGPLLKEVRRTAERKREAARLPACLPVCWCCWCCWCCLALAGVELVSDLRVA